MWTATFFFSINLPSVYCCTVWEELRALAASRWSMLPTAKNGGHSSHIGLIRSIGMVQLLRRPPQRDSSDIPRRVEVRTSLTTEENGAKEPITKTRDCFTCMFWTCPLRRLDVHLSLCLSKPVYHVGSCREAVLEQISWLRWAGRWERDLMSHRGWSGQNLIRTSIRLWQRGLGTYT